MLRIILTLACSLTNTWYYYHHPLQRWSPWYGTLRELLACSTQTLFHSIDTTPPSTCITYTVLTIQIIYQRTALDRPLLGTLLWFKLKLLVGFLVMARVVVPRWFGAPTHISNHFLLIGQPWYTHTLLHGSFLWWKHDTRVRSQDGESPRKVETNHTGRRNRIQPGVKAHLTGQH